jgi:hypothetical protein
MTMHLPVRNAPPWKTLFLLVFLAFTQQLYSQGHYGGGSFNTNDYFIPPTPGWVLSLYYAYAQTEYHDDSGNKTQRI